MTEITIVAIYDTLLQANAAVDELLAAGIQEGAIIHNADPRDEPPGATPEASFWTTLFEPDPVSAASAVVTVRIPPEDQPRVTTILEAHDPIDLTIPG